MSSNPKWAIEIGILHLLLLCSVLSLGAFATNTAGIFRYIMLWVGFIVIPFLIIIDFVIFFASIARKNLALAISPSLFLALCLSLIFVEKIVMFRDYPTAMVIALRDYLFASNHGEMKRRSLIKVPAQGRLAEFVCFVEVIKQTSAVSMRDHEINSISSSLGSNASMNISIRLFGSYRLIRECE